MELKSILLSRPFCFFTLLSLMTLLCPSLLTHFWIKEVKRIQVQVQALSSSSDNIGGTLMSEIGNVDALLTPLHASTSNLVRILGASIAHTNFSFPLIQEKVAPALFQAVLTIPYLTQISYIGSDGLLFSYYAVRNNRHFAQYSNSSLSASSTNYTWYKQPVDEASGTLIGEETVTRPSSNVVNASWFQEALTSNGSASVGYGWSDASGHHQEPLIFNTVAINGKQGAISLGFPVRLVMNFFSFSLLKLHNCSLYLATRNGTPIISHQEIPNTQLLFSNDSVSLELVNAEGDRVGRVGTIKCQRNDDNNGQRAKFHTLSFWGGSKHSVYCLPVEILGVQLVYVLAVPHHEGMERVVSRKIRVASELIILMDTALVILVLAFVISIASAVRREMCLCSALIKQMEATQQAERKSLNKSLAFARASHDVRASLAGINGLIEISKEGVPPKSELGANLLQMEECTRDLLGILNSILDTSKIEAGKMQLEEEEFDLQKLVEDVVDLHYNIGMKKGVDVILDVHDGSLTRHSRVKGDRGKLKQILDNLLNNAVKFTSEGQVTVSAWAKKPGFEKEILASNCRDLSSTRCMPCLFSQNHKGRDSHLSSSIVQQCHPNCIEFVFEVCDTGKGIPKEKQKYVFENYVQVKQATSGQEGTGLGLGIVQSLVRLMGGEIGIVDKQVGEKGTCFRFNTYFTSEPKDNGNHAGANDPECESQRRSGPRIYSSPKVVGGGSQIVIFIQNDDRRRIIQNFMESSGIKVFVVKEFRELSLTLQRIRKGKASLYSHSSSGESDVCAVGDRSPLSAMDGTDSISPVTRRANVQGTSNFILLLIDTSGGPWPEIHEVVKEFRMGICGVCCRVVWMETPGARSLRDQELDELTDLIVSKPLHGSRLREVLKLLPEFGGEVQPTTAPSTVWEDDKFNNTTSHEPSTSATNAQSDFKSGTLPSTKEYIGLGCERLIMIKKKVLVVEDNSTQQMVAKHMISKLGAEVDLCETGAKAVELISKGMSDRQQCGASSLQPYDYILMDCKMEDMDGFEATRRIREEEENYGIHIPIIALTAHTMGEVIELIKRAGMDHYLSKPLRKEQLLEAFNAVNK